MNNQTRTHHLLLWMILMIISCQEKKNNNEPIDYFGQTIPTEEPTVFAPDVISLEGRWEGNANFSRDGKEFYFNVFKDTMTYKAIYRSERVDGQWTKAEEVKELSTHNNWEPFLSYTGNDMYFVSSRPPGNEKWNGRIWKTKRTEGGKWGTPEFIDVGFETENGFWFPNHSPRNENILFFGGNIEGQNRGKGDLYYIDLEQRKVTHLEALSSEEEDWDPFISPDEDFLLWASARPGGYGATDLYVSFRNGIDWGAPINLGDRINTEKYEVAPRISSDGKILFFDRPENGTQDIYWVSSSIIYEFKK